MKFKISKKDQKKYKKWAKKHIKICPIKDVGPIGGRISFRFTPTSLGTIFVITCVCGEELDLTDSENW